MSVEGTLLAEQVNFCQRGRLESLCHVVVAHHMRNEVKHGVARKFGPEAGDRFVLVDDYGCHDCKNKSPQW